MSIYIGNNKYKEIYLGSNKISEVYLGSNKIFTNTPVDPYNPLNLPANTVRVRTSDGNAPTAEAWQFDLPSYTSATLVTGTTDVYDIYKSGTSFYNLLANCTNVVEVLGANTTGITNMSNMFTGCRSLTTVPLFDTSIVTNTQSMFYVCAALTAIPLYDTSNVTVMSNMCRACASLTSIPLFNTSKVTNIPGAFASCINVQSGALALYQQMSTQTTPPGYHTSCFYSCGSNTTTGAAELAQIPSDWKS